jgi:hypothetical protein
VTLPPEVYIAGLTPTAVPATDPDTNRIAI